jgi:hypothetical protein
MTQVDWDQFKNGWATGSMTCRKCGKIFEGVRFRYSCHDKVEGEWPECCGDSAKFNNDWHPDNNVDLQTCTDIEKCEDCGTVKMEQIRQGGLWSIVCNCGSVTSATPLGCRRKWEAKQNAIRFDRSTKQF